MPSFLEAIDVQEEKKNRSSKRLPLFVSARPHFYRGSLVVSEPADGNGSILINAGEDKFEDEDEIDRELSEPEVYQQPFSEPSMKDARQSTTEELPQLD